MPLSPARIVLIVFSLVMLFVLFNDVRKYQAQEAGSGIVLFDLVLLVYAAYLFVRKR